MPVILNLAASDPDVRLVVPREHELAEARALLADDEIDLALTYDYDLAPATADDAIVTRPLWSVPWALGVPAADGTGLTGSRGRQYPGASSATGAGSATPGMWPTNGLSG